MLHLQTEATPPARAGADAPWIARAEEALALFGDIGGDVGARVVGHFEHRGGVTVVRDVRGRILGHADDAGTWDADGRRLHVGRVPEALLPVASPPALPH